MEAALPLTRRALASAVRWRAADDAGRAAMVAAGWLSEPEASALSRLLANVAAAGEPETWLGKRDPSGLWRALLSGLRLLASPREVLAAVLKSGATETGWEAMLWHGKVERLADAAPVTVDERRRGDTMTMETMGTTAKERVRAEILARGIPLGEILWAETKDALARDLGVSGSLVRQAFVELRREKGIEAPRYTPALERTRNGRNGAENLPPAVAAEPVVEEREEQETRPAPWEACVPEGEPAESDPPAENPGEDVAAAWVEARRQAEELAAVAAGVRTRLEQERAARGEPLSDAERRLALEIAARNGWSREVEALTPAQFARVLALSAHLAGEAAEWER